MFGVMSGSTGVVGQLLASGADVGAVNCRRKSALELAMFIGEGNVIAELPQWW